MLADAKDWTMRWKDRLAEYWHWGSLAKEQTGKSLLTQLREIRALARLGGQCGLTDYYWYKLYDDAYQEGRGAPDFVGWKLQAKFSLALNPRHAVLPAWDKAVFTVLADAAGLPVAPFAACFHTGRRIADILGRHLKTLDEALAFLRDPANYPLFGKPVYSQQGVGAAFLAGYDEATDSLLDLNGGSQPALEFVQRLHKTVDSRYHKPECGYLFQRSLKLHPAMESLTHWSAICGVRVICLNGPQGAKPIRAVWKIAVRPNHVDNFSLGKYGNLLANVDLTTGQVSKVVRGFWPDTQVFDHHPDSGADMRGFSIPCWSAVLDTCAQGGAVFPMMRIQHWDFAITDQGPMLLELNDIGGTEIAQVHGRGLLTEEVRDFLKRHANSQAHRWVKAL
jgi:hypothetical protein